MGIFGGLSNDGLEEAQDRVGGGGFILDTDIYNMTVKMAYATKSQGGAQGLVFIGEQNGKEYRETLWVTSKKGENFYLNKDDKTKKIGLPGFVVANDICMMTTEKPLSEQASEEKIVNIYDFDQKKEIPTSVPVLIDLLGKPVSLAILRSLENKSEKSGEDYVPTADTREVNTIEKVFHTETKLTMVEATRDAKLAEQGKEPLGAQFWDSWLERNQGQTRDKRTIKEGGSAGSSGRPGAPASGAPSGERKSLFGSKG